MKELAYSFVELFVIVLVMVTLAVSTAAVAQWANSDNDVVAPAQLASDTVR